MSLVNGDLVLLKRGEYRALPLWELWQHDVSVWHAPCRLLRQQGKSSLFNHYRRYKLFDDHTWEDHKIWIASSASATSSHVHTRHCIWGTSKKSRMCTKQQRRLLRQITFTILFGTIPF